MMTWPAAGTGSIDRTTPIVTRRTADRPSAVLLTASFLQESAIIPVIVILPASRTEVP